jgi:hypothetical protein
MRPPIAEEGLRSSTGRGRPGPGRMGGSVAKELEVRPHGTRAAVLVALVLTLAACGDGRRAELQIVVHARSVPAFGGRVRGVLLGAEAVRYSLDIVEIGGRPCRVTGLVITSHNPDRGGAFTRAYTARDLFVPLHIPAYGTLHLDRNEWISIENYFDPPRISLANSLVLDVAVRYRDGRDERVATATFGPSMPMD